MKRYLTQFEQWAVRTLCAVALLFVGFAHQVPALSADAGVPNLTEYTLPDGTVPTLCVRITDEAGKQHDTAAHFRGCEACRITASVLLPTPTDLVGSPMLLAATVELPRKAEAFHRQLFPRNIGPRAPPSDPILA
ncbi:hypothetical protein [Rhizobium lentis]|uniref:DUF2946 domain-containing protein n=1 Tax=Rhizobium lentis TaxID=1138194 RepID=A0A7W8XHR9_9HYPH|nr:hypothetical protein [Rhizobium lentis]MBB4576556.1 hypothetical protein [Rhizobium lentis]MBB5552579.1 hypothetical protein [Rhizobium lentis]MBB5563118.1 hypothetical protein [Rhizobium lentis]MBB5569396.1 hypothetical protein [Rhizobium lentis]